MLTTSAVSRIVQRTNLRSQPFGFATYVLIAIVGCSIPLLISVDSRLLLVLAAILFGWAEIDGACGLSHVSTLAPTCVLSDRSNLWFKSMLAYSCWGVVTAAGIGAFIGFLGTQVQAGWRSGLVSIALIGTLTLLARELGLINFSLLQLKRQTQKMWALRFGIATAAGMWGGHIGLGFATVIQHGGIYVIAAVSILLGPKFGAILMATFWVGRTLPVWFGPMLTHNTPNGSAIVNLVEKSTRAYQACSAAGLLMSLAAILMM